MIKSTLEHQFHVLWANCSTRGYWEHTFTHIYEKYRKNVFHSQIKHVINIYLLLTINYTHIYKQFYGNILDMYTNIFQTANVC